MPDFNPTQQSSENSQSAFTPETDNSQQSFTTGVNVPPPIYQEENVRTYSDAEVNNPSVINVTIPDKNTPIMVLFGPPQSGKTMTMIRMAEYLSSPSRGYTVAPVNTFRASYDTNYAKNCREFNGMINSIWAAKKSEGLDFMLLNVSHGGNPVVQILEAPGEHYYDPNDPNEPRSTFLPYITSVIQSPNRKIWVYLAEPNWKDNPDRTRYAQKIAYMKRLISPKDKCIVLFNKVDQTNLFNSFGQVNQRQAENTVDGLYPGLFNSFKNLNPISSLWKPYNCTLVPFVTGSYDEVLVDGIKTKRYTQGPDSYPDKLWAVIRKIVRG